MHIDDIDYTLARAGVAVSNSPIGPFLYLGSFRPNGQMSRDLTLFKDDDGLAYVIYSSEENRTAHVARLSGDFLRPTSQWNRISVDREMEAHAVFRSS